MLEVRVVAPGDVGDLVRVTNTAFSQRPLPDDTAHSAFVEALEGGSCLGGFVDGELVGATAVLPMEVTLPGPTVVPMGGVTAVGVLPTHRRRGVLSALMNRQLVDMAGSGLAAAGLMASESVIYGRFGYGWASSLAVYEIERRRAALRPGRPSVTGSVHLVDREASLDGLINIYDLARRRRVGAVSRPRPVWTELLAESEVGAFGNNAVFCAVHLDDDAALDGYALYRVDRRDPSSEGILEVAELMTTGPGAEQALWEYVLGVDLVERISLPFRPVDEPLRWLLSDGRALQTRRVSDGLWLRVLDVPALLGARQYRAAGSLVLEVFDRQVPAVAGTWVLEIGHGGPTCTPVPGGRPDLTVTVDALGSLVLGGVRPALLATSGGVVEHRSGSLALADLLFSAEETPRLTSWF